MHPGTVARAASGTLLDGSGCATQRQRSLNNSDSENLIVVKIDHTINAKDSVWYRFQQDTGLQAAYTDPINSIFNAYSPQPQRTLVVGLHAYLQSDARESVQSRRKLVLQHLRAEQLLPGAADLSHRARVGQRQRAFHHHRRH